MRPGHKSKRHKTENIMASNAKNANAKMVVPNKPLSQPTRSKNPFVKLSSAARQPMRKLFKTYSQGSCSSDTPSTATETTQVVKTFRFSEKNPIRKTLSRANYTLEESKASWMSHEDGQQIQRQCRKEIKKIDDGQQFKDHKYCARGLEGQTRIGSISKTRNRALAMNAVLDEQSMQWEEGVFDEDTIAEVYYRSSSSCQLWASLVGRRDHRAAEEIHAGSSYKKSSAPHYHHHEQTTKEGPNEDGGIKQSSVAPRAA
jgi:hypothetical protein